MDETNNDDQEEKSRDENSKSDDHSGFKLEKELLEKRHQAEIEQLKETFSKEQQKFLETHNVEQSVGQSTSDSFQYGSASHSKAGFVSELSEHAQSKSGHAQSNGFIHNSSTVNGLGNHVSRSYDESSQNISTTKLVSASSEQGYETLPYARAQIPQRELPNVQQQQGYAAQIGNHAHLNGFGAGSGLQLGLTNGGISSHLASSIQNGNSPLHGASVHQDLSNTGFYQQQTNSHFLKNNSINSAHNTQENSVNSYHNSNRGNQLHNTKVLVQNDAAVGLGYKAKMAKYSDGDYSHFPKGRYDGSAVIDVHQSNPWTPEFYTYNSSTSKESMGVKNSTEKEGYGVSLELMNGHAMRVNSGSLASQIRPDLDFEDRLEQQREMVQDRFAEEKRQLRSSIQEEFTRKSEIVKRKYEESFQSIKKQNLELEYQRKESEVRTRHELEKMEMTYENRRADYERKLRKDSEDYRSKSELKYESEMLQQKEKFGEVIEKQKRDIELLTVQIGELNESLRQEKDLIVAKFESEVKDIEQRLRIQKEKTESELVVKLKSEISLVTSVNQSLREEVDTKEREKQYLEMVMKEERRRTEENYESQINEVEVRFETEKQTLLVQYEKKVAVLIKTEKSALVEASKTTSNEMISLRKENETLKKIAEKNYELEQQSCSQREELVQGLIEEKEILKAQLQEAIFKQQHASDIHESEGNLLRSNNEREREETREIIAKIHNDLKCSEENKRELTLRVEGLLTEVDMLNKRQEETRKVKEEKERVLNEVTKLNEEIDKMFEDVKDRGRREVALKGKLNEVDEVLGQKETENTALKMKGMESENKINVLERQGNDLKEDLSTLRRQKVEVEQENGVFLREKSDYQGKLSVLKATNEELLLELQRTKLKISQGVEEVTTMKLGKLELQQEVRMLKIHQSSLQEVSGRLSMTRSDSDGSGSILTSADDSGEAGSSEKESAKRAKKRSTLERRIHKLKRAKGDYEVTIEKLKLDIEALEREAMKQIEHNKALSVEFVAIKKDLENDMEKLKCTKRTLEDSVADAQQQERIVRGQISVLEKQKKELECALEFLMEDESRTKEENEKQRRNASKVLDMKEEQIRREISVLETNKKDLQDEVEKMESVEAALRCGIEELQKESEILEQRISEMNEGVQDMTRKRVTWTEDGEMDRKVSLEFKDVKREILRLRRERNDLFRSVNELERKQTNLDISVNAAEQNHQLCEKDIGILAEKKKELEFAVISLRNDKVELETNINEHSTTSVEHATCTQRKEIEMLRSELEITRENCESFRSMYQGVQNEGHSKVEIVEAEIRMAEDSLLTLKRERLELEKTISTLLRQKTELESEVAMVVDAKYREDRYTTTLRGERLDLDAEVMRLKTEVPTLRDVLSTLEDTKCIAERELEVLETRKERVDRYVSGMEARLLIAGQVSPVSWNFNQSNDYVLTPIDDLERQVLDLKEQKLSLEADLFKLRRKSGDGIDTGCRAYGGERTAAADRRVSFGYLGTTEDYGVQCTRHENESLQRVIEGLAQEKSKLSSEVTEMTVRKTDLDVQITNLEYRKLGLEQSGRLVQRGEKQENNDSTSVFSEATKVTSSQEFSPKEDFVDYNVEQMQELRQKNISLETKLSTLERHLHEAKHEMEMQTMEYQNELHLVQDTIKFQQNKSCQQHQLNLVADRLKTFIAKSESSNANKLYEEIKNEIKELNDKVETNSQQMRNIHKRSLDFEQEEMHFTESTLKTKDVDEICIHIKDAEEGVERYNHVVSYLQKENVDLMEIVGKLEERLSEAGKSHEMLQRKKVILQQLLEKVGGNIAGEDLIEQSNLIFELDKDMPV